MTTLVQPMPDRAAPLRRVLQTDAVVSFGSTAIVLLAAGPVEALTGIPVGVCQIIGVIFLLFSADVAYIATRPTINLVAAQVIMYLNFAWVALSAAALIFGWLPLTAAGFWLVVVQLVVVDLLGVAQFIALRRSR